MAKSYFISFADHEELVRNWLGLAENSLPPDPSLHDLLQLPETCDDQKTVKERVGRAGTTLRKLEAALQRSADPASRKVFSRLQRYIASAERYLSGDEKDKYLEALHSHRARRFEKYLKRHCDPASKLSPDLRARLLQKAAELRLPVDIAEQTLNQYQGTIPETYRDLVRWLGLRYYPEDPVWPTHFDVLGLPDGQAVSDSQIQKAKAAQLGKMPDLSRHSKPEKRRSGESVRDKVESAAQQLSTRATQYTEQCEKHRLRTFRAIIKEHQRLHQTLSREAELKFVAEAASLRVPEASAREAIGQVFPGQGTSGGQQQGGNKPPVGTQPQPQSQQTVATSNEVQGISLGVVGGIGAGLLVLALMIPWLAIVLGIGGILYCLAVFGETEDGRALAGVGACLLFGVVVPIGRYMGGSKDAPASAPGPESVATGQSVPGIQQPSASQPAQQRITYAVRIETQPQLAYVVINGRPHGQSPVEVRLEPGSYRVEVSKHGHQATNRVVAVADHDQALTLQLKRNARQIGIVNSFDPKTKIVLTDLGEIDGLSTGSQLEVELSKDEVRWQGDVLGYGQAVYSVMSVDESSCRARFESGSEVPPVVGDKVVIKRR